MSPMTQFTHQKEKKCNVWEPEKYGMCLAKKVYYWKYDWVESEKIYYKPNYNRLTIYRLNIWIIIGFLYLL